MATAPDGRVLSPGEVYEDITPQQHDEQWREDLNITLMCPDCREMPPNLVEEFASGDTVCASCGRVLADRIIDTRSEWRTFSNDDGGNDDPSRVGDAANPLLHGSQLQTDISFADGGMARDLSRAQYKSSHDRVNKHLQAAYGQITAFCDSANIPKLVVDTTKILYKKVDDAKILKGKSQMAIIAGCIVLATRQHGLDRSFREIYRLTNVSKKDIGKTFKVLENYLHKESGKENAAKGAGSSGTSLLDANPFKLTKSTEASDLISRACNKLGLDDRMALIAQDAASKVSELGVAAGRSPLSITGACIYLIAALMGQPRSPKQISKVVDVSDATIRSAYKRIHASLDQIIDKTWIERGGDRSKVPVA